MDYKGLFERVLLLLKNPSLVWKEVAKEKQLTTLYSAFIYPLIAITASVAFVGQLIYSDGGTAYPIFQEALTTCCAITVALFGGVYLVIFSLDYIISRFFKDIQIGHEWLSKLVGYSYVVVFLYMMVSSLFPNLTMILFLLQFYVIHIVWQGLENVIPPEYPRKVRLTCIIGGTVIILPTLLEQLFIRTVTFLN